MSYKFDWEAAFLEKSRLGPTGTAVALCMMHFASGDGSDIFPSITRLCEILGRGDKPASRSTVVKWLQVLVDDKWLVVTQPGTFTSTTHYQLNIPGGPADGLPTSPGDGLGSTGDGPPLVQEMDQGGPGDGLNQTRDQTISNRPPNRAGPAAKPRPAMQGKEEDQEQLKGSSLAFQPPVPQPRRQTGPGRSRAWRDAHPEIAARAEGPPSSYKNVITLSRNDARRTASSFSHDPGRES